MILFLYYTVIFFEKSNIPILIPMHIPIPIPMYIFMSIPILILISFY